MYRSFRSTRRALSSVPSLMIRKYSFVGEVSQNAVKSIKINNPAKRNALSYNVLEDLVTQLKNIKELSKDINKNKEQVPKVVVIWSEGPVFCSGHDLKELRKNDREFHRKTFQLCNDLMELIRTLDQPVIARVQGLATAAGCQIVGACDLAICTTKSQFATPGVKIGLFCTTPGISIARSLSRKKALEMLLTGQPISAQEALQYGLVNKVVEEEDLDKAVTEMAQNIAQASFDILQIGKKAFYQQVDMNIDDAYKLGCTVMTDNMAVKDCLEGIDAFIEKRKPKWEH
jgi:enoyl-CoA hydratase/carnithine racemase